MLTTKDIIMCSRYRGGAPLNLASVLTASWLAGGVQGSAPKQFIPKQIQ